MRRLTHRRYTGNARPATINAYVTFEAKNSHLAEDYASLITEVSIDWMIIDSCYTKELKARNSPKQLNVVLVNIGNDSDHIRGLQKNVYDWCPR